MNYVNGELQHSVHSSFKGRSAVDCGLFADRATVQALPADRPMAAQVAGVYRRGEADRANIEGLAGAPDSNTGAQNAKALIDTLSLLFKDTPLHVIETLFGAGEEWVELDNGLNGFPLSRKRGGVRISYHPCALTDPDVHVYVTGQGCRQLEAERLIEDAGVPGWVPFLAALLEAGGKFTRLDVALDEKAGILKLDTILGAIQEGGCVTRFKKGHVIEGHDFGTGGSLGKTAYFGSANSLLWVRMYDKAKEQLLDSDVEWVRCEIQARKKRAQQLAEMIVNQGLPAVVGVLRNYIDFRVPQENDAGEKHRWPVAAWWGQFLDGAERLRLAESPVVRTVHEVAEWFERQVSPSLAVIANAPGYGVAWIKQAISAGETRLRANHIDMLVRAERFATA